MDGVISLGAAVTLTDALQSADSEAELLQLFLTIGDADGRVSLPEWRDVLLESADVLERFTGLAAHTSPRFAAFFELGRAHAWMGKIFRRLGLDEEGEVTWEEFVASVRASGS